MSTGRGSPGTGGSRRQRGEERERDSTQLRGAVTDRGPAVAHFPRVTASSQLPGSEGGWWHSWSETMVGRGAGSPWLAGELVRGWHLPNRRHWWSPSAHAATRGEGAAGPVVLHGVPRPHCLHCHWVCWRKAGLVRNLGTGNIGDAAAGHYKVLFQDHLRFPHLCLSCSDPLLPQTYCNHPAAPACPGEQGRPVPCHVLLGHHLITRLQKHTD